MIFIIYRCEKAPDCVIRLPLVVKVCELLKGDATCNSSSIFHRSIMIFYRCVKVENLLKMVQRFSSEKNLLQTFSFSPESKLISQGEDELVLSVRYSWGSRPVLAVAVVFSV